MMEIVISPSGELHCVYSEAIDLHALGLLQIHRASHVEPDIEGLWWADLSPVSGPKIGPYIRRSDALDAERYWLSFNWLIPKV
jgi:hypothetical protein